MSSTGTASRVAQRLVLKWVVLLVVPASRSGVISRELLLDETHVSVAEVRCSHDGGWSPHAAVQQHGLVLVQAGTFRRRADGVETLADRGVGYLVVPETEESFAHPHGGDICTSIRLSGEAFDELSAGRRMPLGPRSVQVGTEVVHRRLLAAAHRHAAEATELAVEVADRMLQTAEPAHDRPPVTRRRRRLADDARQALVVDPTLSLTELAQQLGASPWYLSRTIRQATGGTLTQLRQDMRARAAIELLANTDVQLTTVAARCGYADQPHLTRELRRLTGVTPARLAALVRRPM